MDALIETSIYKFRPNILEEVRKKLNLHQKGLNEMIDNFEDWISKQNHFTKKKFDRRYLEAFIIQNKGSLERAKSGLDKLCTLKTLQPHFFSKYDAKNEIVDTSEVVIQGTMPRMLPNNYRLFMMKLYSTDFDSKLYLDFQRFFIMICEYAKFYDYYSGVTILIDCRFVNVVNLVTKINIMDTRNSLTILTEGYNTSISGIHLLSSSKAIDLFVGLLKQVISPKIANRIHVHETVESLYEYIPQEYFPQDYGGPEKPLKEIYYDWMEIMSTPKNVAIFKDIYQAGTDEKLRLTANYNEQILGMPGSFRTLTVD